MTKYDHMSNKPPGTLRAHIGQYNLGFNIRTSAMEKRVERSKHVRQRKRERERERERENRRERKKRKCDRLLRIGI